MVVQCPPQNTRIEFRIDSPTKDRIERAAKLMGMNISQFASSTLLQEANRIMQEHHSITLNDHERDRFLAMLDADEAPSQKAMDAAARYKARNASV